jgi:hypothetical protein
MTTPGSALQPLPADDEDDGNDDDNDDDDGDQDDKTTTIAAPMTMSATTDTQFDFGNNWRYE